MSSFAKEPPIPKPSKYLPSTFISEIIFADFFLKDSSLPPCTIPNKAEENSLLEGVSQADGPRGSAPSADGDSDPIKDKFSSAFDSSTKVALIRLLKDKINESLDVSATIGSMHLKQDFRIRYERNRSTLIDLKRQLNQVNTGGGSSGCYIATMAYGDYDHPQVMILRQFRDDVLNKSAYGKWFIKIYYHYSPKLVERLKNQRTVNIIIRKTLNQFIKLIK